MTTWETPVSRWVARLVSRHLVLGTLFESLFLSAWIALLGFVTPGVHLGNVIAVWLLLFVVFTISIGVHNAWKLKRQQ